MVKIADSVRTNSAVLHNSNIQHEKKVPAKKVDADKLEKGGRDLLKSSGMSSGMIAFEKLSDKQKMSLLFPKADRSPEGETWRVLNGSFSAQDIDSIGGLKAFFAGKALTAAKQIVTERAHDAGHSSGNLSVKAIMKGKQVYAFALCGEFYPAPTVYDIYNRSMTKEIGSLSAGNYVM